MIIIIKYTKHTHYWSIHLLNLQDGSNKIYLDTEPSIGSKTFPAL